VSRRVNVMPGEVQVSSDPDTVLVTLLGSCVAACLYDPVARVFGMNHFLLAGRRTPSADPITSEAGRYGIHAMELLINGLLKRGGRRDRLKAKVFGGANVLASSAGNPFAIGEINGSFVKEFLENEGIPLLAADLGGEAGRQVHFRGRDFAVYVKLLQGQRVREVVAEETRYGRRSMAAQSRPVGGGVTFFDP